MVKLCPFFETQCFKIQYSTKTGKVKRNQKCIAPPGLCPGPVCGEQNQSSSGFPDPENGSEMKEKKNDDHAILLEKGFKSFENPVLRGSFTLVLTNEQMDFYEKIGKKAFCEIMSYKKVSVTNQSPELFTKHLQTDRGRIQNKRPGVYVIMNIQNGKCIIGQTRDLRKRFNQYTSRGKGNAEQNRINKNFFLAVQKELQNGIHYCQVFQRFVVYTWVDEKNQPLDVQNSFQLKNEMRFLEHRLLLAFFECGLCYNFDDVSPQLVEVPKFSYDDFSQTSVMGSENEEKTENNSFFELGKGPKHPKPFQVKGFYFFTTSDYGFFRKSLSPFEKKNFLSMPRLRLLLKANEGKSTSDIRYLTPEEIQKAQKDNLFFRPSS
jgi:hypothetical protein